MHHIARRPLLAGLLAVSGAVPSARGQTQTGPSQGNQNPGGGAPANGTAGDGRELRLGALYPFSGPLSVLGDESFRGLEMAVEERNAAGGLRGRPLRLAKGDAADATAAVAEARRLTGGENRVAAVFGTYSSALSFAASQVAEAAGVPYFELGAVADGLTERGLRQFYRACPRASDLARLAVEGVAEILAPLLRIDPRGLRVGVLHEDSLYGNAVGGLQDEALRGRGIALSDRIPYPARGADFAALVQRLRGTGTDVVLHAGEANDVVQFFRAQAEASWRPLMVVGAGAGYSLSDMARAVGAAFNGVMNADFPQFEIGGPLAAGPRAFADSYKRRYGADPRSGHSLTNYQGARLFLDALGRAGSADKDRVRAAILATDVAEGTAPNGWGAQFDDRGQNQRAWPLLHQWQDGRLVAIAPATAAAAPPRPELGRPVRGAESVAAPG